MSDWDVIVAGAGPAGCLAARELALGGAQVLLVDREIFPRWKVCGGCLGPAAVQQLQAAGLADLLAVTGVPLTTLALSSGARRANIPLRGNVAWSRAGLDADLASHAVAAGIEFRHGVKARIAEVAQDAVMVELRDAAGTHLQTARVVLDATGLVGGLWAGSDGEGAGVVGSEAVVADDARIGVGAVFDDPDRALPSGELQMIVGSSGYVGLVRVEDGTITVGAAVDAPAVAALGLDGAVAAILDEAGQSPLAGHRLEGWRGTPRLTRRAGVMASRRVFRLGDAAAYVEPFTGEGMGWAMSAGLAVAPLARLAISGWRDELAAAWETEQQRRAARAQRACRWLSLALRRPRLVGGAVTVLGLFPSLAAPFVRATART